MYKNYTKDRRKNALLPEANGNMEWHSLFTIDTNINFRLAVERRYGKQQLTINAILLQNLLKFILRNLVIYFFEINKACKA